MTDLLYACLLALAAVAGVAGGIAAIERHHELCACRRCTKDRYEMAVAEALAITGQRCPHPGCGQVVENMPAHARRHHPSRPRGPEDRTDWGQP